jgi:hypothetical protein
VSEGGAVFLRRSQFFLAHALAGERVGLRELDNQRWLVSFLSLDLGHFDERTGRFERTA